MGMWRVDDIILQLSGTCSSKTERNTLSFCNGRRELFFPLKMSIPTITLKWMYNPFMLAQVYLKSI